VSHHGVLDSLSGQDVLPNQVLLAQVQDHDRDLEASLEELMYHYAGVGTVSQEQGHRVVWLVFVVLV
jgi:hypothetical protein